MKKIIEENNLKEKEKKELFEEKRLKEKSIILKRKQEINEKMKNILYINNKKINPIKKNYLYLQMENNYLENEKNLIKEITEKKKINQIMPGDAKIINKKIIEAKNKLEERALKQKIELRKLWHSRSVELQKLKTPIFNEITECEDSKIEKGKNIKQLINKKKEYIKKHIKLPPISEILKKEIQDRLNKNSSIISRNNNINNNHKQNFQFYSDNNSFSNDIKINIRIKKRENSLSKKKLKSISIQTGNGNHIHYLKNINNNINKKMVKSPSDYNYLEEIRQKRLLNNNEIKNNNFNSENYDLNIENKIEAMESKYKRNKQLLKINGGYLNNRELSDNMNELLIDCIKQKLSLIENK